jgi:hypothetical protein
MKKGDIVEIKNVRDDSVQQYELVEILEESIKVKHPEIKGYFIFSKTLVKTVK